MYEPLLSVCIPAYRQPRLLARCLDSVLAQDYRKVEVVVSDDSPGEDIKELVDGYSGRLNIRYFHHDPPLRSPRNWNRALDEAQGELVTLMHQDDWYADPGALSRFVEVFRDSSVDFAFCRNTAVDETGRVTVLQALPELVHELYRRPNHLVRAQVIGPPSNTVLRRSVRVRYDERLIWLVDVDYYVRLIKEGFRYRYIDRHLVSIGLHEEQTTVFCRNNGDIIFRENVLFASGLEPSAFSDIQLYDYFWRLLRNNSIRTEADLIRNGQAPEALPPVLRHMLSGQQQLKTNALHFGPVSKLAMGINYLTWKMRGGVA